MNAYRSLPHLLVAVTVLISACSPAAPQSSGPAASSTVAGQSPAVAAGQSPSSAVGQMTQTSDGGQVTVVATWAGPSTGAVFDMTLDTHSVDLDAMDLADAVLRSDRGQTLSALPWTAPLGGHHRAGMLQFGGDAASFFAGAQWVELVLTGIGELPERTLRWDLGG